jgi:hypothetical protein
MWSLATEFLDEGTALDVAINQVIDCGVMRKFSTWAPNKKMLFTLQKD